MNRYRKAGLLIVTLVIPALVFTFLKFFATNHYDLPYYHPQLDVSGGIIAKDGDTLFHRVKTDLKPVDSVANAINGFEGKLTVVNYVPEVCSDSCTLLLDQLERIYALRENIKALRILSVTFDWPAKGKYPTEIGKNGWDIGLFSNAEKGKVLFTDFRFDTKIPKSKTDLPERKLVLIDRQGFFRGYYIGTDPEEIDRLMAEIKILNYEEGTKK
jgi:protein SCO1/2